MMSDYVEVEVVDQPEVIASTDYDKSLFEISNEIDMLSSQTDRIDCFVAVASGLLCGMMDVLWAEDFDLLRGREVASAKVNDLVVKTARMCGCKSDNLKDSIAFLEKKCLNHFSYGIWGSGPPQPGLSQRA